ncbi:hypothetical protein PR048_011498 [Dryococelus australis]|uniref:HAT C-terminal dimerisation domain-containing protein n=1 Tax=Dryococelus australis TaxID=614101 RepID=A0ABQ9HLS2_9NEOP|nr:hypothetical protein PR048_011498 [Dryococelus australis]
MTLLKELKVIERDQWPSEKPPGFGEIEIERLFRRFKLTASNIKNGSRVSKELNLLFNCIKLIICCSTKCERGFSQINFIILPTLYRITIPHVSILMFVKLHGPTLREWNAEPYVTSCLRKHWSANDT